jgi:transcriptional regulator with XRE-family HTH domain
MHDDIVKAREALGLSQAGLARRAGISRSRLQDLESGENVTLDTLRKVVAVLPNLKLHLQWATPPPGREGEIQQALRDIIDGANRLLRLFERPAAPGAQPVAPVAPVPESEQARWERIRRIDALVDAGKPPIDEQH